MWLQDRNAIVYGAGGSLGGAVARALAAHGARVFVTGRRLEPVKALASEIVAAGGRAEAAAVDALNQKAVEDSVNDIVRRAGTLDVSFNAIGLEDRQGDPWNRTDKSADPRQQREVEDQPEQEAVPEPACKRGGFARQQPCQPDEREDRQEPPAERREAQAQCKAADDRDAQLR